VTGAVALRTPRALGSVQLSDEARWDTIIASMEAVIYDPRGTGRALGARSRWRLAGKSGTAQVFSVAQDETYNEEELAERMRDHALFVAFAPIDEPRIAVAVIVENGGSGSGVAGPVALEVIEAYLAGAAPPEPVDGLTTAATDPQEATR
jgi:penicillin-binding protein 2